jgi:hypothetical protein
MDLCFRAPQTIELLISFADANRRKFASIPAEKRTDLLRRIIEGADIVWGLWHDPTAPLRVGALIIKGEGRLMLISQAKKSVSCTISAVHCRGRDDAETARLIFGDGRAELARGKMGIPARKGPSLLALRPSIRQGTLIGATERIEAVARLAAQLSREDESRNLTVDEIAPDALALVNAGVAARRALEAGKSADKAFERAAAVAERYRAEVIREADLLGMVLGLRFTSGRFTSGARDIFYVW